MFDFVVYVNDCGFVVFFDFVVIVCCFDYYIGQYFVQIWCVVMNGGFEVFDEFLFGLRVFDDCYSGNYC